MFHLEYQSFFRVYGSGSQKYDRIEVDRIQHFTMSIRMKFILLNILFIWFAGGAMSSLIYGQIQDSLSQVELSDKKQTQVQKENSGKPSDTGFSNWMRKQTRAAQEYYFGNTYPYAGRSALLSTILPGAGQVYNRQSWKVGLVWGGIGFTLYNLDQNLSQYRRFRDAYELSIMGEEHALSFLSENALKTYRDQFRSNLELNYIALGAIYLLNIAEAFISGHLAGFDVSENLSFHIPPGTPAAPLQVGWVYRF